MDIMRTGMTRTGMALVAILGLASAGCQEDNEAASRDEAAKSTAAVDPAKSIPQSKSMADYMKNNPGMKGAGAGAGGYSGKKR